MEANDAAFAAAERLVDAYLDGDTLRSMFELVLLLRELSAGQLPRRDAPLSPPVKAVLNRINQELTRQLSIKLLAEGSGLSASHLRRKFREELGIALGDYLAERRLNAARRLLEETDEPVGRIAAACGYDSIYSFSRFFRKRTRRRAVVLAKERRALNGVQRTRLFWPRDSVCRRGASGCRG